MNIEDVNDKDYLQDLTKSDWLYTKDKIQIGQFLKYGFIPYNDHGFVETK